MKREDWQAGFKTILPVCISYLPIGLACGVLLQQAGFNHWSALLMSLFVYGGASQFMIASMTMSGAGIVQMVVMVFFINLRHVLMSSSLAHKVRERSTRFNMFFSQLITDESFAINTIQYKMDPGWTSNQALAAGVFAYATWAMSTFVGAFIGSNITISIVIMNYLLTAMFLYLFVLQMENRIFLWTALVAGSAAIFFKMFFQNGVSVLLASVLASLVGLGLEMKKNREEEAVHES
ncbi:AzlC family ABC transporter permease [Jeotgalibaca caeni]|uniref:AzlC family ABC transporter permease n=1 Tax=Jeotgalibaca caeni TaxID=3028623 RepID=UPI00237EA3D2|nr:AzlC family ABC transporter permease [Jeotgalibaca caeni]MDE1549012.1 AzlC family ABC transporter permease [Jeotgalibaca caeni]